MEYSTDNQNERICIQIIRSFYYTARRQKLRFLAAIG